MTSNLDDELGRPGLEPMIRPPYDYPQAGRPPPPAPGQTSGFRGPMKRLIITCDGTWLDSDNGMINGKRQVESNVTRIARAIKPYSHDGIQQIVYYHKGIGSTGGQIDRIIHGATGEGLNTYVREAYSFISNNYAPGDEIFLLGFSRGAFTARTVCGMIDIVGVLTKSGLTYLPEIYLDILHRRNPHYHPRYPNLPFPNKPAADNPRYKRELARLGFSNIDVPIKVVGVWDTVGSLGIPRIGVLQNLGLQGTESREMAFYDTKLGNAIENAFQALALDERRVSFSPAVWEKPEGNRTRLRQVWFPGVHSNVGGGYDDEGMSNITLAWMMDQLSPFLDMYNSYILEAAHENDEYYKDTHQRRRAWAFGEIYNSVTGAYIVGGTKHRTPGQYFAVDPDTGRTTKRPLRDTHEYVHPSVRVRYDLHGPGIQDRGDYDPPSLLDDWKLVVEYPDGEGGKPDIYWKARFRGDNVSTRELPESPLWAFERQLLALDPKMEKEVFRPPPTTRPKSMAGPGPGRR